MRTSIKGLLGLVSAVALAVSAQSALAGITGSKHDLNPSYTQTTEICVFCHTPHGAATVDGAPLWNKNISATVYDVYTSATMDGDTIAGPTTVSLACLSCHDGTQGRDNMINQPGTAGYVPGGTNPYDNLKLGAISAIIDLGTNLSNDHPIGMFYAGSATALDVEQGVFGDGGTAGVNFAGASSSLTDGISGPSSRLWIDTATGSAGTFEKTDLPLYGSALLQENARVECATCHDPHTPENGTFLRVSNTGSAVCLTCHIK